MVFPIFNAGPSCDYHRVINPLSHMGYNLDLMAKTPYLKALQEYPVVFFNRLPAEPIEAFLSRKKQYGFRYIVDMDDLFTLPETHYLYQTWKRNNVTAKLIMAIKNADAVTCTNSVLASHIKDLNPNVIVIPNALPFYDDPQFSPYQDHKKDKSSVRIIYAAGASHAGDVLEMYKALYMLDKIPKFSRNRRYEITLAGVEPNHPGHKPQWDYMREIMSLGGRMSGNGKYSQINSLPVTEYMRVYNGADIAVMPLVNSDFNQCKSNLKVLEAGAKGIPAIASDVHPYRNKLDKGYVTLCKTAQNWFEELKYMIDNPSYMRECGEALASHVRLEYDLSLHNETRRELFDYLSKK